MILLPRSRMISWLGAASGAAILAIGWWLCREATGSAAAPEPSAPRRGGVVCVGYVDVESGLTSLYPLQPGRVVSVPVAETDHVGAGVDSCIDEVLQGRGSPFFDDDILRKAPWGQRHWVVIRPCGRTAGQGKPEMEQERLGWG